MPPRISSRPLIADHSLAVASVAPASSRLAGRRPALRRTASSSRCLALALGPEAMEAAALRRRHVAHAGPAAGERQGAETTAAASEGAEDAHADLGQTMIELGPLGEECPQRETVAVGRRRQLRLGFALAPMAHHLGPRNLHRANALAAPAA